MKKSNCVASIIHAWGILLLLVFLLSENAMAAVPPTGGVDLTLTPFEDEWSASHIVNITDPDNAAEQLDIELSPMPANGIVSISNDGFTWAEIAGSGERINSGDIMFRYRGDPNFNGTDTFKYRACDQDGMCTPYYTADVTVSPVNDRPSATDIAVVTDEDMWSAYVSANVSDPDGDPLALSLVNPPTQGQAEIAGGSIRYRGDLNYFGNDSFTYKVCDNNGACSTVDYTATVTINSVNDMPVGGVDLTLTPFEDEWSASHIVNITDPDNAAEQLDIELSPMPANGIVSISNDGFTWAEIAGQGERINSGEIMFRYRGDPNFNGTDTFKYRACDQAGMCTPYYTVDVTVSPVNDPPSAIDITATVNEDTISSSNILAFDVDSNSVTASVVTPPTHGAISFQQGAPTTTGGALTNSYIYAYIPNANWFGIDSIVYKLCDPEGGCSPNYTISITVNSVGDAPIGGGDFNLTANEDSWSGSYTVNITDPDNVAEQLDIDLSPMPANGSVSISNDGLTWAEIAGPGERINSGDIMFRYRGDPNYSGTDTFKYRACDQTGLCTPYYTVNVNVLPVNDPPTAIDIMIFTDEDTWSNYVNTGALDPDGDPITMQLMTPPAMGVVEFSGITVRYQGYPDYNGTDSIDYRACDDKGACSATHTAIIEVTPVNDPPVITPFTLTSVEDTPTNIAPVIVTDVEGDPTSWTIKVMPNPAEGTVERLTDAFGVEGIRFAPALNWSGSTSVTLEACENGSNPINLCSERVIPIDVTAINDAPVVNDVFIITEEDVQSSWVDVNATDPEGSPLTYNIINAGTVGGTGVLAARSVPPQTRFEPNQDWFGNDIYNIEVCDDTNACNTALAHVTVTPVNDTPVLDPVNITTDEDVISVPVQLVATDPDPTDTLTYSLFTLPPTTEGVPELRGDLLTFAPAPEWNGTSQFFVEVCDDSGVTGGTGTGAGAPACSTSQVTVTVNPTNDPPSLSDINIVTDEDVPSLPQNVVINDIDTGDTHTVIVSGDPAHGTITVNSSGEPVVWTVVYSPDQDWFGNDAFMLTVCDAGGLCDSGNGTVTVNPVNDPPSESSLEIFIKQDTQSDWMEPTVLDSDPGQSFHFNLLDQGADLSVAIDPAHTRFSVMPNRGYFGDTSFQYEACDQDNACITTSATVHVLGNIGHEDGPGAFADIPLVTGGYPMNKAHGYPVTSEKVIQAAGDRTPLTGTYDLEMTWMPVDGSSIDVNGQVLSSGATGTIRGYDFTVNGSKIVLPARFPTSVAPGYVGDLVINVLAPSPLSDTIPAVRIPVHAWNMNDSAYIKVFTIGGEPVAKMVQRVVIKAVPLANDHCSYGIVSWQPAFADAYAGSYTCATQWEALPAGITEQASYVSAALEGYFSNPARPDTESISWRMGLVQTNSAGQAEFLPAMDPAPNYVVGLTEPVVPQLAYYPLGDLSSMQDWVPAGQWPALIGTDVDAGVLRASASYDGILLDVTQGGGTQSQTSVGTSTAQTLKTSLTAVGEIETVNGVASYLRDPATQSTVDLTFSALPNMPSLKVNRVLEARTDIPLEITGSLGKMDYATGQMVYDEATYGRWNLRLYQVGGINGDVLLTGPEPINPANGGFTLQANIAPDFNRIQIYVIATLLNPDGTENEEATIRSSSMSIVVRDASAIQASLILRSEFGRAPFVMSAGVALENTRRYMDIGQVQWEESSDGVSFQPVADMPERSVRYLKWMMDPGERWLRATLINRFSGETFVTNVVHSQAYLVPQVSIDGFNSTFVGHPVTWNVVYGGAQNILYEWVVRKNSYKGDPIQTGTGPSITLPADEVGNYYVALTAIPADSADIEVSKRTISKVLQVKPPYISRPRISGPRYVEVGKTYTFEGINQPIIVGGTTDLFLEDEWELPNGVVIPGTQVDYTIQPGDTRMTYRVWVNGYKAQTLQSAVHGLYAWEYQWPPNWQLITRSTTVTAPARVTLTAMTDPLKDIQKMGLLVPTYTFSAPPETTVTYQRQNKLILDIPSPGTYPVEVLVDDGRGNQSLAVIDIVALDPPPLTSIIDTRLNDRWYRAPLVGFGYVYPRNVVSGETVTENVMRLDGIEISRTNSTRFDIPEITQVGSHVLESELTMSSGRTAITSKTIEVIEGELPQCSMTFYQYPSYTDARVGCTVPMGRIMNLEWYVYYDDVGYEEHTGVNSYYGRFYNEQISRGIGNIRVVITNDKGQVVEVNQTFPGQ